MSHLTDASALSDLRVDASCDTWVCVTRCNTSELSHFRVDVSCDTCVCVIRCVVSHVYMCN